MRRRQQHKGSRRQWASIHTQAEQAVDTEGIDEGEQGDPGAVGVAAQQLVLYLHLHTSHTNRHCWILSQTWMHIGVHRSRDPAAE